MNADMNPQSTGGEAYSPLNPKARLFADMRNLPVVCIDTGRETGVVGGFLVDPEQRRLAAFVLGARDVGRGVRVLPIDRVKSLGGFALTVESEKDIIDLVSSEEYLALFEKDIQLLGVKALSSGEKLLGYVRDVTFDRDTGALFLARVASDASFLSPFQATIPFGAIGEIRSDAVILTADADFAFSRESDAPTAQFDQLYVPLVLKEEQMRAAFVARVSDEMEKLRREVRESLEQVHEEHFIQRWKPLLRNELMDDLRREADGLYRKVEELLPAPGKRTVTDDDLQIALSGLKAEFDTRLDVARENVVAHADELIYDRPSSGDLDELRRSLENRIDSMISEKIAGASAQGSSGVDGAALNDIREALTDIRSRLTVLEIALKRRDDTEASLRKTMESQAADEQGVPPGIGELITETFGALSRQWAEDFERRIDERISRMEPAAAPKIDIREILKAPDLEPAPSGKAEGARTQLTEDEAVTFFGRKITRSIIGKRVSQDLYSDDQRLIIRMGEAIDDKTVDTAKACGKFLELSLIVVNE